MSEYAVLVTIVQSCTADHARQLAEHALQRLPAGLLQQQASVLALQDAFVMMTMMVGVALLATLFVRDKRPIRRHAVNTTAPDNVGSEEEDG